MTAERIDALCERMTQLEAELDEVTFTNAQALGRLEREQKKLTEEVMRLSSTVFALLLTVTTISQERQ